MKASRLCKLTVSLVLALSAGFASAATASADKVLLYGPSTFGGANSIEAQQAAAQGFGVDIVDGAGWDAMTTAQFAQYRALIIPDNHDNGDPADYAAAENNAGVWGAAVNGNVIITGADPEYHGDLSGSGGGDPGAVTYISRAVAFAASAPIQTGAYVALDSTYSGPARVLDAFGPGAFTATNTGDNNIHIDPAVAGPTGLSDSVLSNWGTTAHSYFTYPSTFKAWAIGVKASGATTTSDGQKGNADFITRPAGPICTVPKLKGKSLKKAKKKLRNANCALGKVKGKKGKGRKVKKQKPKAGTLLPVGSKVKVTLH